MIEKPSLPEVEIDEREYQKHSRRSVLKAAMIGVIGLAGFEWINRMYTERGLHWILRSGLNAGDNLFHAIFRQSSRALEAGPPANPIRFNGNAGLEDEIDEASWFLKVTAPNLAQPLELSLDELKTLPAVDEAFLFKCIEGWSQNVQCRGVRFSDFVAAHRIGEFRFAKLTSINGGYYVSMDWKSLMHPQTLLCYAMSGEELEVEHGYPLRLMTPVKYGVKNIKQIGSVAFTNEIPADYWAERGYGDYLGL